MGAKISIDSATLFNKGLEVIRGRAHFSGLTSDEIECAGASAIHCPRHGVFCPNGSVLAQLGCADMRIPIAHTLAWPERVKTYSPRLDLAAIGRLGSLPPPDANRLSPHSELRATALRAGRRRPNHPECGQ